MTDRETEDDYVYFWLDRTVDTSKVNRDVKGLIQQRTRCRLWTCAEPDECINRITSDELSSKRVILIISNEFGPIVLRVIHTCSHIQNVYVYCTSRLVAEQWSQSYTKVTHIFTDKKSLLQKIYGDVCVWDIGPQLPMSVFHLADRENAYRNLTSNSAKFMWYQAMIVVLRLMAKQSHSKTDMISECLASYHDDEVEKKKIEAFNTDYVSKNVLRWYTCDSFVYRLLNRAFRTQRIEIIFKFRFFIDDLHNRIVTLYQEYLKNLPPNHKYELTVYRGQHMNIRELVVLQQNVCQLISMNSFLSATKNKDLAKVFADTGDQTNDSSSIQSVLFIMKISHMTEDTSPFAFIQPFSCNPSEEEVLFSVGTIFEVKSVVKHEHTWYVTLQLSEQEKIICRELSGYMIKHIGPNPNELSFGWLLYRMNDFSEARRYAEYLLKQYSNDKRIVGDIYTLLGLINEASKCLPASIENYDRALDVYKKTDVQSIAVLINAYTNLGLAYIAKGDSQKADEQRRQAEEKLVNSHAQHDRKLTARVSTLKGRIQRERRNYQEALQTFQSVLEEKFEELPENHPSFGTTFTDMGIVYEKLNDNDRALHHFNQALSIYQKTLAPDHVEYADCLENMSRVNVKLGNSALASQQSKLALNIMNNNIREDFHSE
ncbi:unnamed protein product [Adineta ricciae]|uniref:NAD(P)(+)--arginine ADP-ribosyltransferase n=1 Tax=Adineta ricciae TaxID=249248 RepID=A0A815AV80_ADIRI|nr:unnamed protein product [Adineta ricciae]CAF1261705.1 unnamed protein product [Adineta ricciae]